MMRLPELKKLLSHLEISSSKILQYDCNGIEIEIIPDRVIYLNYQAHQIQIDPNITYTLSVNGIANCVKIKRKGSDQIDLPTKQIKGIWTDLLSTLLSLSKSLVREDIENILSKWKQLLETQIKAIPLSFSYDIRLSVCGVEIEIEMGDGTYCFRWDQMGNLYEEGSNSAEWDYNNLEFLDTAKQLNLELPNLIIDSDSDAE